MHIVMLQSLEKVFAYAHMIVLQPTTLRWVARCAAARPPALLCRHFYAVRGSHHAHIWTTTCFKQQWA